MIIANNTVATIRDASYGLRDFPNNKPGLHFVVSWENNCLAALICFQGDEAERFFIDNKIYGVEQLNGRKCLVRSSGFIGEFVELLPEEER